MTSMNRSNNNNRRVYVGNLPSNIDERDLEDIFYKYGDIADVDLKLPRYGTGGTPFAFVEFQDPRDAEDAVRGRDGYEFDGQRIRVEFPRRSEYRVLVSGLPPTGSWQDLKDHMRDAGDVQFTDVFKDGTGIVEYSHYDDMKYALKHLDDSKFRSHEGEVAFIRVKADSRSHGGGGSGGGGGRSPSRSRSRSRSRTPKRRSRSRSPRRSYSPKKSKSPSRSPKRKRSASPRRSRSRSRSRS